MMRCKKLMNPCIRYFFPMTQEYYIISGKSRTGPYDLVAIVRKIRNGSLTAHTQLQMDGSPELKPAHEWEQLAEFFGEIKEERQVASDRKPSEHRGLGATLQSGWRFLQRNQYSTVSSGLFVLLIILVAAAVNFGLPPFAHVFAYMAFFIVGHSILSCYMFAILRLIRGQPVDLTYLESKISPAIKPLLLSSLFICIPAVLGLALLASPLPTVMLLAGLFLFAVPGLLILSLYAFTPLLILDKEFDFWEGMETSRKTVLKSGLENTGIIYALLVINFLAGLCFLLPLAITLPITMGALSEIYDDIFS
jgi:hypothetical protein